MSCECQIDITGEGDGVLACCNEAIRKARKKYGCYECEAVIEPGDQYECATGVSEREWYTIRTCMDCKSVRDALFCRFEYGVIWDDIWDTLRSTEGLPAASCMMAMTKTARDKICDLLEEVWEAADRRKRPLCF